MFDLHMRAKVFILCSALLIAGILPVSAGAQEGSEGLSLLAENLVIHAGVLSVLEEETAAAVIITFDVPPIETGRYADHPAAGSDVHPLLFDLVAMAEPGTLRLEEAGSGFALHARMSAAALGTLGGNPDILAVELDPSPDDIDIAAADLSAVTPKLHCPCTPTIGSTVGCLQGNRWRVRVNHGGTSSKVAAYSSQSAAFWTYSSTNWEVLAKVLNGCSVNNRWWVFAAGATGSSFSVTVTDANFCSTSKTYNSSSSGNPIIDTAAFTCP